MFYRHILALLSFLSLLNGTANVVSAAELPKKSDYKSFSYLLLKEEPVIRIGLATNAGSATITTTDSQLVSVSPNETQKFLSTTRVTVAARSYRPPEVERYFFEIPAIATQDEANLTAQQAREVTGDAAGVFLDAKTNTWRVRIGDKFETTEEADEYKKFLIDKGFEGAEMMTEKFTQPSADAVALANQLKSSGKSEVRSLIKTTASTAPTTPVSAPTENLREVMVSGANEAAKFSSLKAVAFSSVNERAVPVRFNGKAYRGKIEVFVNSRGSLTVVNAVPIEDYLLGVVPNELGFPALEAQKAQAVAARTYAIANIGQFGSQGFDLLPTIRSQVYQGVSSETAMTSQAVRETRGIVATYKGKPINALYTSTCGGRTENSENIFEFAEPYLRGVECSLEGRRAFEPFIIKTLRVPARIEKYENLELVRMMSQFALNNFQLSTPQFTDKWFEEEPTTGELSNWLNNLAARFGKTFPNVSRETLKPVELARILSPMIYGENFADTLLSESDITYQLTFDDAKDIAPNRRADVAILLRDGFFRIRPDFMLKPNKAFSRAELLRVIEQIYDKKKWLPALQTATTKSGENGKLVLQSGKSSRTLNVRPDVFLFRAFGDSFYQVKEAVLIGGETISFRTNALGEVDYLEIKPSANSTSPEKMSPLSYWNENLSPAVLQSRLARYVRGLSGSLIDVKIAARGYSRRAAHLEIITTTGTFHLKGGKIRSALRFKEQLFALNKRYDSTGRAIAYNFTGRGWGHGVGMCQYGAYGLAKMGVYFDEIIRHYYSGVDLTKTY